MLDHIDGSVHAHNSVFHGHVIGVNLGTIIYGRPPEEQERQYLVHYLGQLVNSHRKMRVAGLGGTLLEEPGIDLASVYIMLAVQGRYCAVRDLTSDERDAYQRHAFNIPHEFGPDHCLPDHAIISIGNDDVRGFVFLRSALATETVLQHQHLVLCGPPGSGKSTFIKHLVWALAKRGLDQINQQTSLYGWVDQQRLLPIFIPLRRLAGMLADKGLNLNAEPKIGLLLDAFAKYLHDQYGLNEPRQLLDAGLRQQGKALFLLDGLDEVPLEATKESIDRVSLLRFLRIFADCMPHSRIVITCRSRAWTQEYSQLTQWPMDELAPFTGAQITHFISYWFSQLVSHRVMNNDQATQYSTQLLQALNNPKRHALRTMAKNPLLLSMMVSVLAENGRLPHDRHSLYEQILSQLLGIWDVKRDGQNLGQAIGDERINSHDLRNHVLNRLSYDAHLNATSKDGRGRIQNRDLKHEFMEYFARINVADPYRAAERCIGYIDQRSGLLHPEDDGNVYAFAHLVLQEYSAGCHLLAHESTEQILVLRRDDRWREPIFSGIGFLFSTALGASKIEQVLTALIDKYEYDSDSYKPITDWYRDLILAAEVGVDYGWSVLRSNHININRIKRILRRGLAQLLDDRDNGQAALEYTEGRLIDPIPLLIKERQLAVELLAGLGDPRYPVSLENWQQETLHLSREFDYSGNHYWRYVPGGYYQVGGWNEQPPYTIVELQPYWVGRFMVTVDQYRTFINSCGYQIDTWWTTHGLQWKSRNQRSAPWLWDQQIQSEYLNQPVYGISGYEAIAYCHWLNHQLGVLLPEGYYIYLASEAEWEVAAAYKDHGQRYLYPWGEQLPTSEHAVYRWSETWRPLSVGLGLIGQTACGVLDMVGNLWEWTATPYRSDEGPQHVFVDGDDWMIVRGGAYYNKSTDITCAARDRYHLGGDENGLGFRCFLIPRRDL